MRHHRWVWKKLRSYLHLQQSLEVPLKRLNEPWLMWNIKRVIIEDFIHIYYSVFVLNDFSALTVRYPLYPFINETGNASCWMVCLGAFIMCGWLDEWRDASSHSCRPCSDILDWVWLTFGQVFEKGLKSIHLSTDLWLHFISVSSQTFPRTDPERADKLRK